MRVRVHARRRVWATRKREKQVWSDNCYIIGGLFHDLLPVQ